MKLKPFYNESKEVLGYFYLCPGCNNLHPVQTNNQGPNGQTWQFNGDLDLPTFSPSILFIDGSFKCHSFVTAGVAKFCGDSTHSMADKSVELPEIK